MLEGRLGIGLTKNERSRKMTYMHIEDPRLLLHPGNDPLDGILEIMRLDLILNIYYDIYLNTRLCFPLKCRKHASKSFR